VGSDRLLLLLLTDLVLLLWEQSLHFGNSKCIAETLREQHKQCEAGPLALAVLSKEYRYCAMT